MENIAIVKEVFAAVATRDDVRLAALCSGALVVEDAVSGVVGDGDRYEGRGALVRYLIASEASWNRRELRPRTFHSLGAGRVMVAGTVLGERDGVTSEVAAAWLWKVLGGVVVDLRLLPTAMAGEIPSLAPGAKTREAVR